MKIQTTDNKETINEVKLSITPHIYKETVCFTDYT